VRVRVNFDCVWPIYGLLSACELFHLLSCELVICYFYVRSRVVTRYRWRKDIHWQNVFCEQGALFRRSFGNDDEPCRADRRMSRCRWKSQVSTRLVTVVDHGDCWWRQLMGWLMTAVWTTTVSGPVSRVNSRPCMWAEQCTVSTFSPQPRHRSSIGWLRDAQITSAHKIRADTAATSDAPRSRRRQHQASSLPFALHADLKLRFYWIK